MRFTLRDYQEDAVRQVLDRFERAARRWQDDGELSAFALSSTTSSGKTVMAAAVIEALFHGNDDFDFERDETATVIWFSDDPSLNEQTRWRLHEAASELDLGDLVAVHSTFHQEKFNPGKVYFLNAQKLREGGLLVRGYDGNGGESAGLLDMKPDGRTYTIWDTIRNTVEDPNRTLYLILDEAHRGMGVTKRDEATKRTIVKRVIDGDGTTPPIPVVWGISATIKRFDKAMEGLADRTRLAKVDIDPELVQASGLLKDNIVLDNPDEDGTFDTVLLRRGATKLADSTAAWAEHCANEKIAEPVIPLLVFQVPNKPDPDDVGQWLDVIANQWRETTGSDLPDGAFAHVLGDHTDQQFGRWTVPYVAPQRVQDTTRVRVLIAKDAISTGWDCPRAEVMVSFRPAKDETHIIQLLGRMVRTPLARRIADSDRLNSVECALPFFDAATVAKVADALEKGRTGPEADPDDGPVTGRRVFTDPVDVSPNPDVPEAVWDAFLALPSQSIPRKGVRPVGRLIRLADGLAFDGLLPDAGKVALSKLHLALDAASVQYAGVIQKARSDVYEVRGRTLKVDVTRKSRTLEEFVEAADAAVIEEAYRKAGRLIGADVARTYAGVLASRNVEADSKDDALLDAYGDVAALGLVPDVLTYLESQADALTTAWLDEYRVKVKGLLQVRRDFYHQVRESSSRPELVDLVKPVNRMENTVVLNSDGSKVTLPVRGRHLLADGEGNFPVNLNSWETGVLDCEFGRGGDVWWYRNPGRASRDSFAVPYKDGAVWKAMRPDFLFFTVKGDGSVGVSIVDPHGYQYQDALPKLVGLSDLVEAHPGVFDRVDAVAKVGDQLRVLDLGNLNVRGAVRSAESAKGLYEGSVASDYV